MAFQIGDMVVRTSGSWRGVNEGDIKKVTGVWDRNIHLEGHPDITFDGENFALYTAPSAPQRLERGQVITYRKGGEVYTGRVQDVSQTLLGVIRNHSGEYDAVDKSDVIVTAEDRPFKVGDRVRMIAADPAHGRGEVEVGEIGVIVSTNSQHGGSFVVNFPSQEDWEAEPEDLEHVDPAPIVNEPEVSLDEAVANWQSVTSQIESLKAQLVSYERVMRQNGIKPI